jgi:TatD DNase family protein
MAIDNGVSNIINVGIDLESSHKAIKLAEEHKNILAVVGIHPNMSGQRLSDDIIKLTDMATHPRVVAIGETGLDYYRPFSPRETQIEYFTQQIKLAINHHLPLVIHCREAEEELIQILSSWFKNKSPKPRGVIHCFNGDQKLANTYLELGFHLSFGGYITYKSSKMLSETIKSIPPEFLLVETDCPFLPPQRFRGKRNEPSYLLETVRYLSEIRGETFYTVANSTSKNTWDLFRRI